MTHGLLTVHRDTSLYEVMDMLATHHVTGLPIVDDGMHLQGMITEQDVLRALEDPRAIDSMAQDHMTEKVLAFDRKARLWDVCECLITHSFRRVPITHQGALVGIVSRADVIRKMTQVFKRSSTDR
jgi:CBS domain-containing protein